MGWKRDRAHLQNCNKFINMGDKIAAAPPMTFICVIVNFIAYSVVTAGADQFWADDATVPKRFPRILSNAKFRGNVSNSHQMIGTRTQALKTIISLSFSISHS